MTVHPPETPGAEPVPCPHPGAIVVAGVGDPEAWPFGVPLVVSADPPAGLAEFMAGLTGLRAWLGIGRCVECRALVAMVTLTPDGPEFGGPPDRTAPRGGATPWVAVELS
jgi:hypothetical protein